MNSEVILDTGYSQNQPGVWSRIDPNEIKAIFHLLNGQPDSTVKVFTKDVKINFNDLQLLYDNIEDKLKHYIIGASEFSMDVKLENGKLINFGNWLSVLENNWDIPEAIDNIIMKWDCLIKLPKYEVPQRHTLFVRMSSGLNPQQVLKLLLSREIEDIDSIERNLAPVICKVDFVNHRLAEEIINIVEEWNKSLKIAEEINNRVPIIRKNRSLIAYSIRYITPVVYFFSVIMGILFFMMHLKIQSIAAINIEQMKQIAIALFFGYISYKGIKILSFVLGKKVLESASEYGEIFTFEITRGDKNAQLKLTNDNNRHVVHMTLSVVATIAINIICGIITNHFWALIQNIS